jgi:hypothetical protein
VLRLSTARKVADVLWPEFREYDGAIVLANVPVPAPGAQERALGDYERFHGHTHIQDVFRWDVPRTYDPEWDTERPDAESPQFAEAWELAQQMGRMWLAKLVAQFPGYRFRVYVTKLDDPIVHFHRVRDGERPWFTDAEAAEQIVEGTLLLLDSGHGQAAAPSAAI